MLDRVSSGPSFFFFFKKKKRGGGYEEVGGGKPRLRKWREGQTAKGHLKETIRETSGDQKVPQKYLDPWLLIRGLERRHEYRRNVGHTALGGTGLHGIPMN